MLQEELTLKKTRAIRLRAADGVCLRSPVQFQTMNVRGIVNFDRSTLKSHLCPIIHTSPKLHQYPISRSQVIVVKILSMGPRDL